MDHAEWLGADIESIGREKAGIFRAGRPALFGGSEPAPASLIESAERVDAILKRRGRDFREIPRPAGRWDFARAGDDSLDDLTDLPSPALAGTAQLGNAATMIAAVMELRARLPLTREAIVAGLMSVRLAGRFQRVLYQDVEWVLDVAHNPDAAGVLAASLSATRGDGRTLAVCGMLADKDVPAVLARLRGCVDWWVAAATEGPRGLDDVELARRAAKAGVFMQPGGTVTEAMRLARRHARSGDRIVVFGSFHTVGPALDQLGAAGLAAACR
jgi:dihydrofolate synthase/folylpolyglutamate synthase